MRHYYPVLTIAGSDPSGGAGIQADLKTFSALGCYGMSAVTALTVQNTREVRVVAAVAPEIVGGQIRAVTDDIPPLAVKIGMLNDAATIDAVARALRDFLDAHESTAVVLDPVMISTSGAQLIDDDAIDLMVNQLFPLATLVTPNLAEARRLTGAAVMNEQADWLVTNTGAGSFLLKGGDSSRSDVKMDYFVTRADGAAEISSISAPAIDTVNTHGTGCTLSAAIAAYMARGLDLKMALIKAKMYVNSAISAGADVAVGKGHGPVNHFFSPSMLLTYESED